MQGIHISTHQCRFTLDWKDTVASGGPTIQNYSEMLGFFIFKSDHGSQWEIQGGVKFEISRREGCSIRNLILFSVKTRKFQQGS